MTPFPEEYELVGLFECEPTVTDRDVPWFYNRLTFVSVRGSDRIECEIEPAYGKLAFRWFSNGTKHIDLDVRWGTGLQVEMTKEREALKLSFEYKSGLHPLEIQLKPEVCIWWGNEMPR